MISTIISGLAAFCGSAYGVYKSSKTKKEVSQKEVKAQFKLASIDKKLVKRQKAYSFCSDMLFAIHGNRFSDIVAKADNWWFKNCLYLEPKSKEAFKSAINNVALLNNTEKDELEKISKQIREA